MNLFFVAFVEFRLFFFLFEKHINQKYFFFAMNGEIFVILDFFIFFSLKFIE